MAPREARIPTLSVQRPSLDSQRTETAPADRTGTAKKAKKHEDATTESSQKSGLSITASNVTTMELEVYLKWIFRPSAERVRNDQQLNLESISKVLDAIDQWSGLNEIIRPNRTAINLPLEWNDDTIFMPTVNSDPEEYHRHMFMMYLRVHDPHHNYIKFLPVKDIEALTYPDPNIFHMYNEKLTGGGIAWALKNTLLSPTFKSPPNTEMNVEHVHSGFLGAYFNLPECQTTSNGDLKFRKEISPFGSDSRPDFVTRLKEGVIFERRLRHDLYPAVFLAEAKVKEITAKGPITKSGNLQIPSQTTEKYGSAKAKSQNSSTSTDNLPNTAAQMAFAAYPSLVIIIASLITQWRSNLKSKAKKLRREDYQIPEWAIIYGIGYAGNGILVYAFFPRVLDWDENNFPKQWGFMSLIVTTAFIDVFVEQKRQKRIVLMRFLLMLQQHANRLKDRLKDLRLPEEFLD